MNAVDPTNKARDVLPTADLWEDPLSISKAFQFYPSVVAFPHTSDPVKKLKVLHPASRGVAWQVMCQMLFEKQETSSFCVRPVSPWVFCAMA